MSLTVAAQIRRCILGSIPERLYDEPVEQRYMYIPQGHLKVLDPNRALVVGGRGTGKTFWWETLASGSIGPFLLSRFFDQRKEGLKYEVSVGYGAKTLASDRPPDPDTLASLFAAFPERVVWKTVVLSRVAPKHFEGLPTWSERVRWASERPEDAARILAAADDALFQQRRRHLIVFDAIDRAGLSWQDVLKAHRGLFGLLLELWGMRAIRAKAFVRQDVLVDPEVFRFPDASKLETAAVELAWLRTDLYGLLWQYLANSTEHADVFRSRLPGVSWLRSGDTWDLPPMLRSSEGFQQGLWHELAGRWMGANERRGDTYRWLTNHLADAFGKVSPRSFLAAVRDAALATSENEQQTLSVRALQEGVRAAAVIRAREIREDFPWAERALEALRHLVVPCQVEEVIEAWERADLKQLLDQDPEARRRRRHGSDLVGVIDDLADLGVMQRLWARQSDRINVPDVYRLRFGIKRKGGVPAAKRV